jgi:hypothetical protein
MDKPSPESVARWMLAEVERDGELYQETAVYEIERKFGREFVYENENGNPAIGKDILKAFRKISEGSLIWERGGRFWRKRNEHDGPGRQQE